MESDGVRGICMGDTWNNKRHAERNELMRKHERVKSKHVATVTFSSENDVLRIRYAVSRLIPRRDASHRARDSLEKSILPLSMTYWARGMFIVFRGEVVGVHHSKTADHHI